MKKINTHFIDHHATLGIFLTFLLFSPTYSESTSKSIDFEFQNLPLKTAIDSLIIDHHLNVVYQDVHLRNKTTTSLCENCSVEDAFGELFKNQNLQWEKTGKQYIIIYHSNPKLIKENKCVGLVKDKITGEPIPYANVHILNTYLGDITNNEGYFDQVVNLDSCTVKVSYIGYESVTKDIFSNGTDELQIIELNPKVIRGEGVLVTGDEIEFFNQPISTGRLSFSPRHIASLPKLGETDVFRSLKLLPGIQIGNIGSAGLYIRGGTPDQNLILLDGMSVYQTDHFYGFFSAINSEAIKDIQIFKGGIPAKYGGRTSSVIELTGKRGNTKKRRLSFYSNLLTAGLTYEEPLFGRGSLFMTYRGSYSHYYRTFLFDHIFNFLTDGEGQNSLSISTDSTDYSPRLSFYDFNGKITFMPNNHNVLSFSYFAGKDDIDRMYDFPEDNPTAYLDIFKDAVEWKNESGSIKWSRIWSHNIYSNFIFIHSKYKSYSFNHWIYAGSFSDTTKILDNNELSDDSFQLDFEWSINSKHDLEFGFSQKQFNTDYDYQINSLPADKRTIESVLRSFYFQDHWNYNPKIELNFGLRLSEYNLAKGKFLEPRISFSYFLTDYVTLKGSVDKYTQFLHRFSNDFMIGGKKYVWILSNEKLKPIISNHLNGGIQYDDKHILSEITIFFREFDHISDFSRLQFPADVFDENANRNYETQYSLGSGVSKGIELMVQKKTGFIKGWSSYSFGITEHSFPDSSINQGSIFSATHDRTHELKTVLTSSFKNWDFSLSWVFSSGSVFTPNGMKYIENVYPYVVIPDSSFEMNSERLPFIRKVNVSVTKHFQVLSMNWEMGLSIFNLLDRKNVSHKKYVPAENSDYFVSKNVEMMGITPSFHVKLSL